MAASAVSLIGSAAMAQDAHPEPATANAAITTPADAPPPEQRRDGRDPNRVICRSEPILGSRIATQRQCFTAAEWETIRQQNRMAIDRAQTGKPTNGG
jgi:hypothetical protein